MPDRSQDHETETLSTLLAADVSRPDNGTREISPRALKAIRVHLGMDVAFISEFKDGTRVFRHVDSGLEDPPIKVGDGDDLADSYCQRVAQGKLPELIRDASKEPAALELPATLGLPVGAHLSVPITLSDGEIYGTFCCFSFTPDESLTERDLAVMKVFAEFVAEEVDREKQFERVKQEAYRRIQRVIAGDGLRMVFQPIVDLADGAPAGFESLARFSPKPPRGPDIWFKEAADVGLSEALDLTAMRASVARLPDLPGKTFLTVNITPTTALSPHLGEVLAGIDSSRVILEVTEHSSVASYEDLAIALAPLRSRGLRVAVDDAGAGYASFRHILRLQPEFIKLDISISRSIDTDPAKRALASALIAFARDTKSTLIAEGVETEDELATLQKLGIGLAQGYFLGRPAELPTAT
ncbi:MAG TPA: EAL domain-containing protein [Actinomycetota bacterium]|nr:EAL domain-containing protein [Actinomycetota bacterium]